MSSATNNNIDLTLYTNRGSVSSKVSLLLNYLGLKFTTVVVNTFAGEQFTEEYKKINIHSRVPLLVDKSDKSQEPVIVYESGAILLYILKKYGTNHDLLPDSSKDLLDSDPSLVQRFESTYHRVLSALDDHLKTNKYINGDKLSAADLAIYPHFPFLQFNYLSTFSSLKNIERYYKELETIPAVNNTKTSLYEFVHSLQPFTAFIEKNKK
ncbi:hypothetical protein CYY_002814 [Polysphondylium violaceum]|uniref:Glutathione S-transferase n=1 Tax=Polysphondylium violaceum TaxID=133409 RepID=A0A8J4PXJ6_9MYCE|nr:hypothetical protein CYY_002814 [Polysphondylium violaceum]